MKPNRFGILSTTIFMGLFLSACAAPQLPTTGTPSNFDGKWIGALESTDSGCSGITVEIEVRYGQLVGKVFQNGAQEGDISGEIEPNGKLSSKMRLRGISADNTNIIFEGDHANGTWSNKYCKGLANLKRSV